jgi:hypothetical protein
MRYAKIIALTLACFLAGYIFAYIDTSAIVYSQSTPHIFNGKPHFQMKTVWCDYDKNGKLVNCSPEDGAKLTAIVQEIVDMYTANCDNDDIEPADDPDK